MYKESKLRRISGRSKMGTPNTCVGHNLERMAISHDDDGNAKCPESADKTGECASEKQLSWPCRCLLYASDGSGPHSVDAVASDELHVLKQQS